MLPTCINLGHLGKVLGKCLLGFSPVSYCFPLSILLFLGSQLASPVGGGQDYVQPPRRGSI